MASADECSSDEFVYRLLSRPEWEAALQLGHYPPTALDRSSDFIHLSTLSQAITTANLYFSSSPTLLLMQLPTSSLHPHLTFDAVPSRSSPMPHLHLPHIPLSLITQLTQLPRTTSPTSPFTLPPHLPSLPLLYKLLPSSSSSPSPPPSTSSSYPSTPKDLHDGFIHLATPSQLPSVAAKHSREGPATLLTIDLRAGGVEGWRVLWEEAAGGKGKEGGGVPSFFCHVYDAERGLPAAAIVATVALSRAVDGSLQLPAAVIDGA